jgi:membrane protease YdiL (CAAX protease family)
MDRNTRAYAVLIAVLAICSGLIVFMPQGLQTPGELPAARWVLALISAAAAVVLHGGLGLLGLRLSARLGFADLWPVQASRRQVLVTPLLVGVGTGVFFVIADLVFVRFHALGSLPHPPFPTSLVASIAAGIGEEALFRLFLVPLLVWVFSSLLFKGRYRNPMFWIVSALSALLFALGHLPAVLSMLHLESVSELPTAILVEIVLLNGAFSLLACYYFRRDGFLAAVGIHFWTDIVWHVIYGAVVGP